MGRSGTFGACAPEVKARRWLGWSVPVGATRLRIPSPPFNVCQKHTMPCAHSIDSIFPMSNIRDHLPLTPLAFEVLLALSTSELHGYAIMRAVEERSRGTLRMHAGTLYRALARMVDAGLLEELDGVAGEGDDDRRRVYRLTRLGREVARAEAVRLESQVGSARAFGLLGKTG